MKVVRMVVVSICILTLVSSCRLWNNVFSPKYGCKTNGKNIGAEKLINGDPEATKAARKAKKFKA
jgi:hypothetical protein